MSENARSVDLKRSTLGFSRYSKGLILDPWDEKLRDDDDDDDDDDIRVR